VARNLDSDALGKTASVSCDTTAQYVGTVVHHQHYDLLQKAGDALIWIKTTIVPGGPAVIIL
jgi:hypothetical protein